MSSAWAKPILQRIRQSAMLAEEIVPLGLHRFDRAEWVLKETMYGFRLWCSLDERAISRPVLLNKYEPAEAKFIERNVSFGTLVVDAGANIGYHSLHLAARVGAAGHVFAFEPLPYLAAALEASVAENAFEPRMTLHRAALDDRPGRLSIRHAPRTENFGGAHFAPDAPRHPAHEDELVKTVRLDDALPNGRYAFMKIDVEGAEARLLRGAHRVLAESHPIILCELHGRQLRTVSDCSANDVIAQLRQFGYRCYELTADGNRGSIIERYDALTPINVIFDQFAQS